MFIMPMCYVVLIQYRPSLTDVVLLVARSRGPVVTIVTSPSFTTSQETHHCEAMASTTTAPSSVTHHEGPAGKVKVAVRVRPGTYLEKSLGVKDLGNVSEAAGKEK